MIKQILVLLGLAAASLFFFGLAADLHTLRVASKPWPVLALLAWVLLEDRHAGGERRAYRRFLAIGLAFSALGDVLLEFSPSSFLYGVGAFLLAHVAYIVAFTRQARQPCWWLAVPFAGWGAAVLVVLAPGLEAASMLVPVSIYTAVICAMMWRASAQLVAGAPLARPALAGALLFAASDTLIAVDRFSELEIPAVRWAIMLLYWLGQALIACSARRSPS